MRVNNVYLPKHTAATMGLSSIRTHGRKRAGPACIPLEAAELTVDDLSLPFIGTRSYDDSQEAEMFWSTR